MTTATTTAITAMTATRFRKAALGVHQRGGEHVSRSCCREEPLSSLLTPHWSTSSKLLFIHLHPPLHPPPTSPSPTSCSSSFPLLHNLPLLLLFLLLLLPPPLFLPLFRTTTAPPPPPHTAPLTTPLSPPIPNPPLLLLLPPSSTSSSPFF